MDFFDEIIHPHPCVAPYVKALYMGHIELWHHLHSISMRISRPVGTGKYLSDGAGRPYLFIRADYRLNLGLSNSSPDEAQVHCAHIPRHLCKGLHKGILV